MTTYFLREEVPGKQFFDCTRYSSTMTTDSCASMWRHANHQKSDRLYKCKSCPVGAEHAGEKSANMSPIMGSITCARCNRGATRLLAKHLCVSCYNRQREWLIGRNAKGKPPLRMLRLDRRIIGFMCGNEPKVLKLELCLDTIELMWAALRDNRNSIQFAFRGEFGGPINQMRLF
jgi:hypothetical protein